MASGKYYRTSNGLLGGVCAGLADYYQADVLPFRLVFVLLLAATLGLFGVVYLVCVLVWPKRDDPEGMYEVRPHTVSSSAYGTLTTEEIRRMSAAGRRRRTDAPRSVGHIPPVPPRSFVAAYGEIAPFFTQQTDGAAAPTVQSPSEHVALRRRMSTRAMILVLVGLFVLTLVVDSLACRFVTPLQPMQTYPLFFVLLGIATLVVPSRHSFTGVRLADGCALVVAGMFGLAVSVGALSTEMLRQPAIVVAMAVLTVLLVVSVWRHPRWLLVAIGGLTVVLAVLAFGVYVQPGPTSELQAWLPLVGTTTIPLR